MATYIILAFIALLLAFFGYKVHATIREAKRAPRPQQPPIQGSVLDAWHREYDGHDRHSGIGKPTEEPKDS